MRDITVAEIIDVHAAVFGISPAAAWDRVHDREGLEAAVVRSANYRHYRDADLALQAAALAHAIAERQIFIDGNKRTALSSMGYFLALNGYTTSASDDERFDWMIHLAHGWGPEELSTAVRRALVPIDPRSLDAPTLSQARHRVHPRRVTEQLRQGREL